MNPARGKSCWQTGYLCAFLQKTGEDARPTSPVLHRMIGFDDDGCDVVVLGVALHECPSCMVKAIRKVRSRILAVGLNVVKHAPGSELVSVRRSRFCNSVGEEQRDLSRVKRDCGPERKLASRKQAERWAGAVQSALHIA